MNNIFDSERQNKLAEKFHALHHSGETLVLPNAWDASSAKLIEQAGFPAVATTSSGVSWSQGYQDGEHIPPKVMIEAIRGIARVVDIPVSADIEAAYFQDDFDKLSEFFEAVIEAGAVGINLEDTNSKSENLNDIELQQKKIKCAKDAGKRKAVNLYVNARVDGMATDKNMNEKIKICIERAKAYEEAGTDGIFIPFIGDIEVIKELKSNINLPLNILMSASLNISELRKAEVNRVTVGGKLKTAALNTLRNIVKDLKNGDDWASLYVDEPNYGELNGWFKEN